jgi:hypothetical protein
MGESSSTLWAYVGNVTRGPAIILIIAGVPFCARLLATRDLALWMLSFLCVLFLCTLAGRYQYNRNRSNLKSILLLFQLSGWPVALSLSMFMWNGSFLTGTHEFYAENWAVVVIVSVAMVVLLSFYYINYWRAGREQYERLASYRIRGLIPADDLYRILTYQGRSTRMLMVLPFIVGISVPASMLAAHLMGRNLWDLLLFVLFTFILSPYIMAVLAARLWLQREYLPGNDLTVVD